MHMHRRKFAMATLSGCVMLSGCSSDSDTKNTPSPMTEDSQTHNKQFLEIQNRSESDEDISIEITDSGTRILKGSYSIESGKTIYIPIENIEEGTYELVASLSSGEEVSQTLSMDSYDIEHGTNVTIEIRSGEISVSQEE